METLTKEQRNKFFKILPYLNNERAYFQHLIDCGEMGIMVIEWISSSWIGKMARIEKDPTIEEK